MTGRPGVLVQRWTRLARASTAGAGALAVLLAVVPLAFDPDVVQKLTTLLSLVLIATTWNALAGYGGMVSIGQQAFIGIGAYVTVYLAGRGVPPYLAMALAALLSGAAAAAMSPFALRLRAAQFAIGMWVVAEACAIVVTLSPVLGGGTGISLIQLNQYPPAYQQAFTYWTALGWTGAIVLALLFLLRSPMGLSLQAIRDDERAAASLGVRVAASKRTLFVLAATGSGAAGAVIAGNTHFIGPTSTFSVQWTAYMIFMVLVGGLGTFEGPVVGAVILFGIQTAFSSGGTWYLVGLGATAAAFALLLPRGLWGTLQHRLGIQLTPIGHRVRPPP